MFTVCHVQTDKIVKKYIFGGDEIKNPIYLDDTIEEIKKKIIMNIDIVDSFDEIYLFGKRETKMNYEQIYKRLTQNESQNLTKDKIESFVNNLNIDYNVPDKEIYEYGDLLNLNIDTYIETIPLGMKYIIQKKMIFTANPYKVTSVEKMYDNTLTTENKNVLFEYGELVNNEIYLCLARDILEKNPNLLKIYFPVLFEKKITSVELFDEKKYEFKTTIDKNFKKYTELINDLHKKPRLKYDTEGIQSIIFTIHPEDNILYPIETFLKLIRTNKENPLIKYNPGHRRENIYRLYVNGKATNGKKIPFLQKNKIMKLRQNISTHKNVGFFIMGENEIKCEIYENGNITISLLNLNTLKKIEEIEEEINKHVNPILHKIDEYMSQNGNKFNIFESLNKPNIEIIEISYQFSIGIKKSIKYNCMSSIFNIIEREKLLKYKRVSNYNEMNEREQTITYSLNRGATQSEIINDLRINFALSEEEAQDIFIKFLDTFQIQRDLFANKKIGVKSNVGFPVFIDINKYGKKKSQELTVTIHNINHIIYLSFLSIYVGGLVIPPKKKCENIGEIAEEEDIIANSEKSMTEAEEENEEYQLSSQTSDILDLLGDDSEEEDDTPSKKSERSERSQVDIVPGSPESVQSEESEILKKDPTGIKIKNPNYFWKRLNDREKDIFVKDATGEFLAYSRSCQSNQRRQPVILTDEEKEYIDKYHPGSYTDNNNIDTAYKYRDYWYICPRYWSFAEESSLSEKDMIDGNLKGKIIPSKEKTIPEGKEIYEFNWKTRHKKPDGSYKWHTPGFLKTKVLKDGTTRCVPCCFSNDWNADVRKERRKKCNVKVYRKNIEEEEEKEEKEDKNKEKQDKYKKTEKENYVKGPEQKLDYGRYGHIPMNIANFLRIKICLTADMRREQTCFLRKGLEYNDKQSFLACIADAMGYKNPNAIIQLKEKMVDILTKEKFLTYQNGTLKSRFGDIENFKKFIMDNTIYIDYIYLWDMICIDLFKDELNLVILSIPEDDITNNVEYICPTNHYRNIDFYNKTLIILMRNGIFEPIYKVTKKRKKFEEKKLLTSDDISIFLDVLKNNFVRCAPLESTKKYTFIENKDYKVISEKLKKIGYKILKQIVNYNNKTIGMIIEKEGKSGYIPCKPSAIDINEEYIYLDAENYWNDYKTTRKILKDIKDADSEIPCEAKINIMEDELIVGILTETNQFIRLSGPQMKTADTEDLPYFGNAIDYYKVDKEIINNENVDQKRIDMVKRIKLETHFYYIFRNTLRIMINNYINRKKRQNIIDIIEDKKLIYPKKLEKMVELLHSLLDNLVDFVKYDELSLDEVVVCLNLQNCKEQPNCGLSEDGCVLKIPENNLISGHNTEKIYFSRLADELIRYGRIRLFILKPREYLPFQPLSYNLKDDEILLMETILLDDYFKDLVAIEENPYMNYENDWDSALPHKSIKYKSKGEVNDECIMGIKKFTWKPWVDIFKSSYRRLIYKDVCTWNCMKKIIDHYTKKNNALPELKEKLFQSLTKYTENIIPILKLQGKEIMGQLYDYIISEGYFLTTLDIFTLGKIYDIPLLVIAGRSLREVRKIQKGIESKCFITKKSDGYYIIEIISKRKNLSIVYNPPTIYTPISELPELISGMIDTKPKIEIKSLEDYIDKYDITTK